MEKRKEAREESTGLAPSKWRQKVNTPHPTDAVKNPGPMSGLAVTADKDNHAGSAFKAIDTTHKVPVKLYQITCLLSQQAHRGHEYIYYLNLLSNCLKGEIHGHQSASCKQTSDGQVRTRIDQN